MSQRGFQLPAVKQGGEWSFNQDRFRQLASRLDDGNYTLSVERFVPKRSSKANRYYWGVVLDRLSEHTGYHPNELHAHFKKELLGVQTKQIVLQDEHGEVKHEGLIEVETTTTMDTHDFYLYVEQIRQIAAELGCVIPDPDKEWMFNAT